MAGPKYLNSLYNRERLKTRIVEIGNVPLGNSYPIRIQSMTNTNTCDTIATVDQTRRLFEAGCDYVRITARNLAEAKNLREIKKRLHHDGFRNPIIADIHFNPEVALVAARIVEKIRINSGNYVSSDKDWLNKSEAEYNDELEKITARIKPLIDVCNEYGTAIRIGTNHGSLSQRIISRYGNTTEGMVQSAMEFIRIMNHLEFHKIVLSMKASDIHVMVHAHRLLVSRMMQEGFNYPLHLGVTEAGAGEDGVIKSASGMGALLADGIGDTIRVSLTGDPVTEIPAAKKLALLFNDDKKDAPFQSISVNYDPFSYSRRETETCGMIGGGKPFAVISHDEIETENAIEVNDVDLTEKIIERFGNGEKIIAVISCGKSFPVGMARYIIHRFIAAACKIPVILQTEKNMDEVNTAAYLSAILIDGYGDAIRIARDEKSRKAEEIVFSLLQAHGLRRTKAEFISCPTCGRTTYNIEKVLEEVRLIAGHLTHLKIAVMGCIVNGPGEMAEADYGCVGSAPGKANIYKGKQIVKRNIPESDVAQQLLDLIIKDGNASLIT